jgi:hypothetical protein
VSRPVTEPCGTEGAYKRHQRHGEVTCRACCDARDLAREDKKLAPSRRAVLAAAVYTGKPRRGTQGARQAAQLRGEL